MGTWSPKTVVVYMADRVIVLIFLLLLIKILKQSDYFNPCNMVLATSKILSFC